MLFSGRKKRLEILVYRDGSIYVEGNRVFGCEEEVFLRGMLEDYVPGFFDNEDKEEAKI